MSWIDVFIVITSRRERRYCVLKTYKSKVYTSLKGMRGRIPMDAAKYSPQLKLGYPTPYKTYPIQKSSMPLIITR